MKSVVTVEEIPDELILHWDQTGIHLVPTSSWTLERQGSKRVEITYKRQITAVFCGSLRGDFLPIQGIYKGKTLRCHPLFSFPQNWLVSHSPKHWSSEDMMVDYIEQIIVPMLTAKEKYGEAIKLH